MFPWAQEPLWIKRNGSGAIVGISEMAPKKEGAEPLNIHDQRRKDALAKTLLKAKEQAHTTFLYLTANDRDPEQIAVLSLALEHIETALEHLGITAGA
ncbi:hypothetical protein J31TS4_16150 [Paenibacillus sp. J31TS4]|nr:hypothetical protein J31TS4_16150 [Paenibacillus sp. J31TS4]